MTSSVSGLYKAKMFAKIDRKQSKRGNIFTISSRKGILHILYGFVSEIESLKNEMSWKSPGILFSFFCTNP